MPTLTPAELTKAYFAQKEMFKDSARNSEYIPEVNVAKAIIENQTANIKYIENADKKVVARIFWNKFCDDTVSEVAPTDSEFCTITGPEADAEAKEYEIDSSATASFSVDEKLYENSNLSPDEVLADLMLKTKKKLDETIAKRMVLKLDLMTSPNLYTVTGVGCPGAITPSVSWASTLIPPAMWTPELMHYFSQVKRVNKFTAPFLLDGKNLNFLNWQASMNAQNANGSGANKMMGLLPYYEDLINVEASSPGKTFMIDKGTVAFANRSRWAKNTAQNPIIEKTRWKYSEKSENIPGLIYDVYVTETCSGPYTKQNFKLHAMWGLYNGPTNCNGGTGVLEFVCGNCLS